MSALAIHSVLIGSTHTARRSSEVLLEYFSEQYKNTQINNLLAMRQECDDALCIYIQDEIISK
jgi:hypothetical protein